MHPTKTIFLAFTDNKSATGDYYRALAGELANRGYAVKTITPGRRTQKVSLESNPAVYTWPSTRPTKFKDAWFLFKLIRQFQPALIMANFGAVNLSMLVSWLTGVPNRLVTYHTAAHFEHLDDSSRIKQNLYKFRKMLPYHLATGIMPVAEALSYELEEIYKIPPEKIKPFHNAIPAQNFTSSKQPLKEKKVICVGALRPGKGQDILLRSISLVKKKISDIQLILVGDGEWKPHLESIAADLDITDNLTFLGELSHEDVLKRISGASLLVLPSRYEAFGLVIIEAMSVKTPVIASGVGGIPEIIRDGVDGFLVPPDAPKKLAEKIYLLLDDIDLRKVMSKNCHARFMEKFELDTAIQKQADWFEKIIRQL